LPPSSMILVADLGNQLLKLGQVVGDRIEASHCLEITDQVRDGGFSPSQMPEAVVYASVNPARDQVFDDWIARRFSLNARKLGRDLPIPIRTRCSGVGADRLLNALAAVRRFPGGAIVVDVGTAVTVDVVSPEEEFLGGAIFPGPHLGAWALAEKAAQLFHVDPVPPVQAIATETAEAIRSGLSTASLEV